MVHRKIIDSALAKLDGTRAQYFSNVVDMVSRDSRTDAMPNLVYLVLKETIQYLPTSLAEAELINQLFAFVTDNQTRLNRIIHDRHYVESPERFSEVTKEFVLNVLSSTLEKHQTEEIQETKLSATKSYRFSYPDGPEAAFPYRDDD